MTTDDGNESVPAFHGLIGGTPAMTALYDVIGRVAPHFTTALVTGETGTGKELVARALGRLSPRADRPFVAVNCSAIVETLFASELFGHVRGAFTGATEHRVGLLELTVPPLAERILDVPLLARRFAAGHRERRNRPRAHGNPRQQDGSGAPPRHQPPRALSTG